MTNPAMRWRAAIIALILAGLSASGALAQEHPSPPRLSGKPDIHRVLVVPVNLRGHAPLVIDSKQIAQALYGATDSVASRYRALSYGRIGFEGSERDVTEPVTLAEPADFCGVGLSRLANEAEAQLPQRSVAVEAYQHIVFVLPKDAPCWWTGLGDIGGKRVWVKATTAKALQHELGHNLGMNHAVRWRGSGGDASDFMGTGSASLNAPHVVEMGWLRDTPGKIVELRAAGDVTLEALESPLRQFALPKVAIVSPAPGANTYYFSYRASGAGNSLPDEFARGLNIHIFNGAQHTGGLTYFVVSLIDGATYQDGPLRVRQLSHVADRSVTFHIDFRGAGDAMPAGPPPAPPGTLQSRASGKCVDLPHAETRDGTQAIQYDCHGGTNQQWKIVSAGAAGYRIVSQLSGKCVGTDEAGGPAGGAIIERRCGGGPDQLWTLRSVGNGAVIRNVASVQCMDVPGASQANGAGLIVWDCNGGTNQIWRYETPATQ